MKAPSKQSARPLAAFEGDPTPLLLRLQEGGAVKDIARELGVTPQAVYQWLLRHCAQEWMAISAARALAQVESAEAELEGAQDNVAVSRARERLRAAQWHLERAARPLYGDTKADAGGVTVNVVLNPECGGVTVETESK